ncbi:MAG TPA: LysE/ArgO family amino acid transporter, partial [Marmoricola sp.]|nr:LysE/ArgO family amino acid transporter [Marmoricola sp.]
MLASALAGFATMLSLIVAIGAQNAYVLRQGILRSHVGVIVIICAASDVILIFAGVSGIGAIVGRSGVLLEAVRWFGVAFLLWYAIAALRRASHAEALSVAEGTPESRGRVIGRAVALTWLNPHVYLDTVLLIGSIAATHDGSGGRWWFGVGAGIGSVLWFNLLGFGGVRLGPLL